MHRPSASPVTSEPASASIELPTAGPLRLTDQPSIQEVGFRLATAARREVLIFSRDLDPPLYDQPPFLAAIERLALARPHLPVRILVLDPWQSVTGAHRLVDLGRRLASRIGMRRTAEEYRHRTDAFLIADATGYCLRHLADRHEALVEFAAPGPAARLRAEFEQIWELSSEDTELRRLTL